MMKKVILSEYFDIISPKQSDKINFTESCMDDPDAIPFLGRSSANNGIVSYVKKVEDLVNEGGVITIALDGSTGSTFYQHHPFSSGQNIWILKPKEEYLPEGLTPLVALFLVTTIRKAAESYTYNLSLTKKRLSKLKILLPLDMYGKIDINYIYNKMSSLRNIDLLDRIPNKRVF
ncbi:restriction endonuclease subunit S [Geobacillus sp. 46C-IIa]|nr:restriction endonuclease subunit S [Geobacillus sp. 46C-IIa]